MKFVKASEFTGERAWQALEIAQIERASIRLHWTDQPYIWHENDGDEVFVVLDGSVVMKHRKRLPDGSTGPTQQREMKPGDLCHAEAGDEHVAHPQGIARILVIEKPDSI